MKKKSKSYRSFIISKRRFRNAKTNKTIFKKLCFEFANLFVTITQDLYLFIIIFYFYLFLHIKIFYKCMCVTWWTFWHELSFFWYTAFFGCTNKRGGEIFKTMHILKQRIDLFNFISQWWITLLRHGRIHIIHLKLAQKHILAVSEGK